MDENLCKAREELITQRINYHRKNEPPDVNAAYMEMRRCAEELQATLSPEQAILLHKLENVYHSSDGESGRFFYTAGMCDALALLLDGRADK
jgi:hypothetical protein